MLLLLLAARRQRVTATVFEAQKFQMAYGKYIFQARFRTRT